MLYNLRQQPLALSSVLDRLTLTSVSCRLDVLIRGESKERKTIETYIQFNSKNYSVYSMAGSRPRKTCLITVTKLKQNTTPPLN